MERTAVEGFLQSGGRISFKIRIKKYDLRI